MLYASLNGEQVRASQSLLRSKAFRCTYEYCSHPELILKKGSERIPHFAHKKASECSKYYERETEAHITMKLCFQQTLGIDSRFVEYGKIKGVRPDILWKNKYAIELQHSRIKKEEVQRRNQVYQEQGLIPVWIFHLQEFDEENAYHERGIFGKEVHAVEPKSGEWYDQFVRLTSAERYVAESKFNTLLYIEFNEDILFKGLDKVRLVKSRTLL